MAEPLIKTEGLKKYFKVKKHWLHAVDDVNISILPGETLGVVGESGCGKSTLGRTILRLHEPTAGKIFYDGIDFTAVPKHKVMDMRKNMQMIFQDPYSSLNPRMSIETLLAEPLKINKICANKKERDEKIAELMETVGLAPRFLHSYPHELDGGRRQRIGVARALALDPKFIVCDEPVSALDVSIQAQILNLLMDLQDERGLTYMFITHDMSVVKHISNNILVMYMGNAIEMASSDELFANPSHPYTRALLSAIPEPDPEMRHRQIEPIKGEISSPIDPKPGCRFAPRCPYATEECHKEQEFREIAPGHFCACHLVG